MGATATRNGGARERAAQAVADAIAPTVEPTGADAVEPTGAPEPTPTDADAVEPTGAVEPTPEPTPEPEPTPGPEPAATTAQPQAQTRLSRREVAAQAQARSTTAAKPLVLAQGLAWREVVEDGVALGRSGITVEADAQGNLREYLTWVPRVGRVQKTPTYGVFPVIDAGDLD